MVKKWAPQVACRSHWEREGGVRGPQNCRFRSVFLQFRLGRDPTKERGLGRGWTGCWSQKRGPWKSQSAYNKFPVEKGAPHGVPKPSGVRWGEVKSVVFARDVCGGMANSNVGNTRSVFWPPPKNFCRNVLLGGRSGDNFFGKPTGQSGILGQTRRRKESHKEAPVGEKWW